jgi:cysteine-rich repeat protein
VEECDDGNQILNDDCLPGCIRNICGDGIVNNAAEACDDGNNTSLDGCSSACSFEAWVVDLGTPLAPFASVISWSQSDGTPVIGATTLSGDLVALHAVTGAEVWRFSSGKTTHASAVASNLGVYLLADDGTLTALDVDGPDMAGMPRWQITVPRPTNGSRVSLGAGVSVDRLVVVDEEGALHQYHGNDGSTAPWNIPNVTGPYAGSTEPRDHYDGGYADVECVDCVATVSNELNVLNNGNDFGIGGLLVPLTDSVWVWQFAQGGCDPLVIDLPSGVNVVGEVVYRGGFGLKYSANEAPAFAVTSDGALMRWDSDMGQTNCAAVFNNSHHEVGTDLYVTSPVVFPDPNAVGDLVLVGDGANKMHALRPADPPPAPPLGFYSIFGWPFTAAGTLRVAPVVDFSYRVFIADEAGNLYALLLLTGDLLWQMSFVGTPAGSPLVTDGGVFLATQAGQVHAFERGGLAAPTSWWSRQGANAKGNSHTPSCQNQRVRPAFSWSSILLLLFGAWLLMGRRPVQRRKEGEHEHRFTP